VLVLVLALAACAAKPDAPEAPAAPVGRPLPELDALFHRDPRWLGADAALTVPLGARRVLWLFGDTFVATSPARVRGESRMVRNSVAVESGLDPRSCAIDFAWRVAPDGTPGSFFPEDGERWFWPGHGIRLAEGPLVLFLIALRATPGEGLGFETDGYALAVVDEPDAPPEAWRPRVVEGPALPFDALPGTAVVREGARVIALAIRAHGTHAGYLVRYPAAALARGDLDGAEWYAGEERGWLPAGALGPAGPAVLIDDAGSEASLHFDRRTRSWVHVASYGSGATTIGLRTAPRLTGPWSAPVSVFRPPESDGPRPFVYAAKAHPELVGPSPEDLLVTYATNSFRFADLFTPEGTARLYWPRFVAVRLPGGS